MFPAVDAAPAPTKCASAGGSTENLSPSDACIDCQSSLKLRRKWSGAKANVPPSGSSRHQLRVSPSYESSAQPVVRRNCPPSTSDEMFRPKYASTNRLSRIRPGVLGTTAS